MADYGTFLETYRQNPETKVIGECTWCRGSGEQATEFGRAILELIDLERARQ